MPNERSTVLLTGASGVLGRALTTALCDLGPVIALSRNNPVADPRAIHVRADVTRPGLGLDRRELAGITARTGAVVHAAALTRFGADPAATMDTNVGGTRNVLALAAAAGAHFYHVSSAFTVLRDSLDAQSSPHAYLASKIAAEEAVAASGLPSTVLRPSLICGDSRTGEIASVQGLLSLAGALVAGRLPVVPAGPGARVDFLPSDVLARAIATIVQRRAADGPYWLTAGAGALSITAVIDLIIDLTARLGRPVPRPRLMPADSLDRLLLPLLDDVLPPGQRRRLRSLADVTPLLHDERPFPSCLPRIAPGLVQDGRELSEAFTRTMERWATDRWGVRAEAAR